jgi:mRNA interferase RelE/StbE
VRVESVSKRLNLNLPLATQIYSREFDTILIRSPALNQLRVERKIDELSHRLDSYPHHRLKGSSRFRIRIGDYRVIYSFDAKTNEILLITIGHRREIYRHLNS